MDLRHLRYFIAVAEEGSLTMAAERRLHVAQPSLSRQIRDLEQAVGASLFRRSTQGVRLTAAGEAFLPQARAVLAQMEAAMAAARRAAEPERERLMLGFLTGQEMDWLAAAMELLQQGRHPPAVTVISQYSPDLADALSRRRLDIAFMRAEANRPELSYRSLITEPLRLVLPSDHPLAAEEEVAIDAIAGESFVGMSATAPVLRAVIETYLAATGVVVRRGPEIDHIGMAISLVASTRAVTLLPAYAVQFLPWSVVARKLRGPAPGIELVLGWHRANDNPVLRRFLAEVDALIARGTKARQRAR